MGATWIHGLGGRDQDLRVPLEHIEGHLLIVGTTGAGKTRAFDLLVTQAVLRDEAVVIIDPKGDQDLRRTAERACALAGRPQRFVYFHPAFPAESVRIDPLHSFSRATELASRVAALIPSETGSDADKARQVLGNINNVVALRVLDAETQKYIAESLPMARVVSIMAAHGSTTDSTNPLLYTGNTGERLMEEEVELFPPGLLGQLPNFEYVALWSGGRVSKGRLPILGAPREAVGTMAQVPVVAELPPTPQAEPMVAAAPE